MKTTNQTEFAVVAKLARYELTDGIDIFRTEIFNEYQIGVAQRTAERETGGNLYWREAKDQSGVPNVT